MAQLTGEFYLDKATFAPGEPVFLYFKLSNKGSDTVEIVIQINGKLKSHFQMSPGTSKDVLEKEALKDPKVQALITGKALVKVIVVPDKLVNLVVQ